MASLSGDEAFWGDRRSASQQLFATDDNVFSRSSTGRREIDDEEALKWAALEKLPTYNRLRKGILKNVTEAGSAIHEEVDVKKLGYAERQRLMEKILRVAEDDNERFLLKLRDRIDKVGIELPKIEVRFEHLHVEADVRVGSRALPTLYNFTVNLLEGLFGFLLPKKKRQLTILKDVSGIIKPSRMTLLLGPPGSGKTTLLLALAGKLDPNLRESGKLTYNGHELTEFVPQRTSAYISQYDSQIAELTVRETLDFSGRCQGVGTRYEMLVELSRRERTAGIKPDPDIDLFMKAIAMEGQKTSIVTDYILKILGLDICADIMVGNQMRRGVSGGQRKRVTTGEMLVGPAKALFMDEISTGLDSSTTFQIVKCLRQTVHVMDGTMVVSLLQPQPETFDLFDDVVLLSEGQIVYQGPRDLILDFFEAMGFKCPERKSVADFLQEVTSRRDQAQYWADRSQPYRYIPVKEFAESFNSFHVGQRIQGDLAVPFDKSTSHPAALSTDKYGLGKKDLFKACLQREWLLMRRNSFLYIFKTCQMSIVSIVGMTVFFRTKLHTDTVADGNVYLGALFFGLNVVLFNGFSEMSIVVSRLPIFYKQRDQLFYPAWAFSIPTFIVRLPLSIIESAIWTCLTYYVIGFSPEAFRFFRHFLVIVCISQMAVALFRLMGGLGRSLIIASTFGNFALLVIFILGGFVLSKDKIPKWWIWAYWISPMMYGQNGLAINEFLGNRWKKPYNGTVDAHTIGVAVLKSRGLFSEWYWYWISIGALIGFIILFNILFTFSLGYLNPLGKPQAILSDESQEKHSKRKKDTLYAANRQAFVNRTTTAHQGIDLPEVRRSGASSLGFSDHYDDAEIVVGGPRKGMVLPFEPLAIAFDNINYYVDMPAEMKQQGFTEERLQLLRGVSGSFRPGVLTALVGVSGAGKTTLMDVLAGRKTGGYIEGRISISGYPKKQETFARISGYCEQNDIHSPNVTVHEALVYSAWLRLAREVDKETRQMFVEEVMELVELTPIRDAMVGLPGVDGLSTEQRKRLTIAVELVANPSIIFMDEPTSGLDARAAAIVMRTVRNTVDTGRTVVCTIHQPSIDIFEAFDELLLMKRGGQVIYAGPLGRQSHALVEYFEAIPGVPKIKDSYNPATWVLEVTTQAAELRLGVDFAELYNNSTLYQRNQALIKELSRPVPGSKDLFFPTVYSQSFWEQCKACLWKQHSSYWRNPYYNAVRLIFTAIMAFLFGTVFWNLGSKSGQIQDLNNIMGAMYTTTLFLGYSNATTVLPVVGIERTVYYRERAAGMYSPLPYAFSQAAIEIPYVLLQSVLYTVIVFSMMNFEWTAAKFFYYLFFMFFTFLYFTYYGMMIISITPGIHFAVIISSACLSLWNLFAGFMIPRTRIPVWWRWFYWVDPVAWSLYGLVSSQLSDIETQVINPDVSGTQPTVKEYIKDSLGIKHDFLGAVVGVHLALAFVLVFVFAFCIKTLNFQKR